MTEGKAWRERDISASLLGQFAFCERAAWFRGHGVVPPVSGGERMQEGRRRHRIWGRWFRLRAIWSATWRLTVALLLLGGTAWLLLTR
ncbi:MAG: CRISPR-associated protein Cas4 [Synergistales bacterium]|nr:CRISPR-associated protein Cas4 [Synergistales bacterium]